MAEIEKFVGGFRKAIQDLLVPQLEALNIKIEHLREDFNKHERGYQEFRQNVDQRFEKVISEMHAGFAKSDEKFARIFSTLEKHDEKFERIFNTLEKHNEKFDRIFSSLVQIEKTQGVILNRLDYGERLTDLEARFERLEQLVKKAS